jgi:hypothetical protein
MKKRNLIIACVLTMPLLSAVLMGHPAKARTCPYYDFCVSLYYDCAAQCNGNKVCVKSCQQDYSQCQCTNCGLCPLSPPPARSEQSSMGAAISPLTVKSYFSTAPANVHY